MKIRSLLFVLICLLCVLPLFSCCGDNGAAPDSPSEDSGDNPTNSTMCFIPSNISYDKPYYTVMADQNLSDENKLAISASLQEWCLKTNGTLRYNLVWTDMSKQTPDTNTDHTIKVYEKNPGPGLAGWTMWDANIFSAYMLIEPGMDANTYRKVMLHELGHAFNLRFGTEIHYTGPYQSVMYPSIGNSSEHLSCPELTSFCNNYACKVECVNVEQGAEKKSAAEFDHRQM